MQESILERKEDQVRIIAWCREYISWIRTGEDLRKNTVDSMVEEIEDLIESMEEGSISVESVITEVHGLMIEVLNNTVYNFFRDRMSPVEEQRFDALVKLAKKVHPASFNKMVAKYMQSKSANMYEAWIDFYQKRQIDTKIQCKMCTGEAMYICAGCNEHHYCGTECQSKAWSEHQLYCQIKF